MPANYKTISLIIFLMIFTATFTATHAQQPNEQNCAATPDLILGQVGFTRYGGVSGETTDTGVTADGIDIFNNNLLTSAAWIMSNLQYAPTGTQPVAIIIADDFSVPPPDADTPDEEVLPVSHGWLVQEVFDQLIAELPANIAANLTVAQLDISNAYTTNLLVADLNTLLANLTAQGINRFVLNMSFVFIPCRDQSRNFDFATFLQRHESNPSYSLVQELGSDPAYVASVLNDNRVRYIDDNGLTIDNQQQGNPNNPQTPNYRAAQLQFIRLFEDNRLSNDPLRTFLRQRNYFIVPVASSGNFKWRRPFFPARWGEVISVSASEGDDLQRWSHANNGSIMVPGAWFEFQDGAWRAGTSFAAPVVSLLVALDLTQDQPICGTTASGDLELPISGSRFDNVPLLNAVASEC